MFGSDDVVIRTYEIQPNSSMNAKQKKNTSTGDVCMRVGNSERLLTKSLMNYANQQEHHINSQLLISIFCFTTSPTVWTI